MNKRYSVHTKYEVQVLLVIEGEGSGTYESLVEEHDDYGRVRGGSGKTPQDAILDALNIELLPKDVRDAISDLLTYNWSDEEKDYESTKRDGENVEHHVFEKIKLIAKWLGED